LDALVLLSPASDLHQSARSPQGYGRQEMKEFVERTFGGAVIAGA